jgi:hypothetical protein
MKNIMPINKKSTALTVALLALISASNASAECGAESEVSPQILSRS